MNSLIVGLVLPLMLSGSALAQQSGEQGKGSSMRGMMQEMMKGEQGGEGSMEGMGGMMRMMKMMDRCSAMMESKPGETKENEKK